MKAEKLVICGHGLVAQRLLERLCDNQGDRHRFASIVVLSGEVAPAYNRILLSSVLAGAVLSGETREGPWYAKRSQQADDISAYRSSLAFGQAFCGARA